ncbi:calcium-binding protein [Methylobacterium sp. Leaf93]|uniref:calcium-binding protein n=1 Tax=Methylobacterium sp. Leaf93 TaxID=1736249 RepID=UPI0006FBE670|nr:calcium-binding protein [Methylobacterium sp. Leaf93]KQP11615.1 hypothetical protein ASF26_20625 [Methylobacterium sp. Leaf93]
MGKIYYSSRNYEGYNSNGESLIADVASEWSDPTKGYFFSVDDNLVFKWGYEPFSQPFEIVDRANGSASLKSSSGGLKFDFSDSRVAVSLRGGWYADELYGGDGNDLLEGGDGDDYLYGGAGDDVMSGGKSMDGEGGNDVFLLGYGMGISIDGGTGTNTIRYDTYRLGFDHSYDDYDDFDFEMSYERGVSISLKQGFTYDNYSGEYINEHFSRIQNVIGSVYSDDIYGDDDKNSITSGGGSDVILALGGNDRIVIDYTPQKISGGTGRDSLYIKGDHGVELTDANFGEIEMVYVRNRASLDMSGVTEGASIVSQSTVHSFVDIAGTSGDDVIKAGKGSDVIDGGSGNDRITAGTGNATINGGADYDTIKGGTGHDILNGGAGNDRIYAGSGGSIIGGGENKDLLFAGSGADTFAFSRAFGRDNIYKFDGNKDHISVSIDGIDANDLILRDLNGGTDTLIYFAGAGAGNKIILHDVASISLTSEHFIFGA